MASKTIVVVLQENDGTPGKASCFDDAREAARFIEDLLAAGFDRRRIRVLAAQPLTLLVIRRPVVSLARSESARLTADNNPRSRIPGYEPRWAPLGDGAVVSIGDCALATISLN